MTSSLKSLKSVTLDAKDAAKMIRRDLKATFPGAKFSVRIDRFAGGSSIHVSYTDGPRKRDVEEIALKYGSNGFDGTDDSSYQNEAIVLTPEGPVRHTVYAWITVDREYSEATVEKVTNMVNAGWIPKASIMVEYGTRNFCDDTYDKRNLVKTFLYSTDFSKGQ